MTSRVASSVGLRLAMISRVASSVDLRLGCFQTRWQLCRSDIQTAASNIVGWCFSSQQCVQKSVGWCFNSGQFAQKIEGRYFKYGEFSQKIRLVAQGFNSTGVLRAAGRGSAPTLRVTRGGGSADRGRGRGRGRGEGYVPRSENGDVGYHRTTQDGWEQVGRKLERSYSRGYEEGSSGNTKREYSRSASDNNWRDKRHDDDEEDEGSWRSTQQRDPNPRWGPQSRRDWREPRDLGAFEGERRLPPLRRGFDQDMRGPRRTSESHDHDVEMPEWVEDDVGDDPGTFDSSGAFVSTKEGRRHPDSRNEPGSNEDTEKRKKGFSGPSHTHPGDQGGPELSHSSSSSDKAHTVRKYIPPNARNGGSHGGQGNEASGGQEENGDVQAPDRKSSLNEPSQVAEIQELSKQGVEDSGFAFPQREDEDKAKAPPGQYSHLAVSTSSSSSQSYPYDMSQQKQYLLAHTPSSSSSSSTACAVGATATSLQMPVLEPEQQMPPLQHQTLQEGMSAPSRTSIDPAYAHVEKSLQNLVAQMTLDAEKDRHPRDVSREALPLTHEHANKWFYKDPQGEIQGPFTNEEMAQWFSAGYFTMSLVVKRGCDDSFKQLGELIKRYGRVPFLPGTPLPPLISSTVAVPEESLQTASLASSTPAVNPVNPMNSVTSSLPQSVPSIANPLLPSMPVSSLENPLQASLLQQMMVLQQDYMKQTFLMRQMQMQTLQQLQHDQDNFQSLPLEQQQQLSMQVMMQANPMVMQQLQHIQQQQLLLQQQLQQHQQQQQQQQRTHSPSTASNEEAVPKPFPQSQPVTNAGISHTLLAASSSSSSSSASSLAASNNHGSLPTQEEGLSVWGNMSQQPPASSVWSQLEPQSQPQPQSMSLWDVDAGNENLLPAYKTQLEQPKRRKEERMREEELLRQQEMERKQEELRRQQEELEQQRELVRREKEEFERQKQIDIQKREEARRQEEEARRLEEEQIQREIENQRREQQEAERRRREEEKKRQEEERKREKELKKQEEKKRKEEEKRRLQEEQRKQEEEIRRKQEEEEQLRQLQLQHEQELRLHLELQQQQQQQEKEEEERMQREAAEREQAEAQKRQQLELQRQRESPKRLHHAQREQLVNMQLPAHSNWANQQNNQGGPAQSRSLTEIQEEEARREQERIQRQQQEIQRMHEQALYMNQQQQQKSWATHASQGLAGRGLSLLDIQQQEQENMKKNQKDKPKATTYQSKLSTASSSTWAAGPPSSAWSSSTSASVLAHHHHPQQVWDSSSVGSIGVGGGIWDQLPASRPAKQQGTKESGEFPALRNPSQQNKKAGAKANSKASKGGGSKQKKDEETVQKLFQTRQQDDFTQWVTEKVSRFSAQIDVPTFVSFIVEVDSPDDVRDYMVSYLGDTRESKDFAKQFVDKRNRSRNQARLEKQQEEDSIWGPAPAVNPHIQTRQANNPSAGGGDGGEGGSGAGNKGKSRKKKQKMQKVDGSILGFTVHSDPNRKNAAGELESIQ
ncbi:perq amino acid-rich with gyf domain-containing protein 2 [Plakobranchus ocellatus]|uniref:Perq amino acid-rich with gyf domain-containing protein 2 n=1 Tax=Plakobranchus ocellatus TaxID=259542 RepID=A0AAV3ZQ20_9GAST|nr:perq amino acid-rich with gyf domain-containing protein 2 [Plakobranchus ocellatus]